MARYRAGDCGEARTAFQRLTFEFPASDERHNTARFYLAECMLRDGEHLEAAREFRRIADETPDHPLAPDALLRAGDAYAELWRAPPLDPTYGETALTTYVELMSRYGGRPAAQRAALRIRELNELFAEKEYRNGMYYFRFRAYDSAIIYFKSLVAQYGESTYAPLAVVKLIEIFDRVNYAPERDEMCGYLRQYYPEVDAADGWCPAGG